MGLLNNEPRWIEPLLEVITNPGEALPWEQNYVMLLWLSHLMLSPFDLATISSFESENERLNQLSLPPATPSIARQVVRIGTQHLRSPTIERKAASNLLVRLCVRQDMLNLGLLGIITQWAITECARAGRESQIHSCLGTLTLLSGLVANADQKMLGVHLSGIFRLSQSLLDDESLSSVRSSALARKLVIKIQRNTVVHCIQADQTSLDTTEVVEEVIGALIELLADTDTPVRMAASKALSLITLKLDPEMAAEVIEAINGSFHEELIDVADGEDASFFSVNAARWHGIVLTFGHLLHRRAVRADLIAPILKSILHALSFEQRSTSGKSMGANVRDAANYGLWAVARRCTTSELSDISAIDFSIHNPPQTESAIQYIALNLLVSACFDPDGNVRRGSSAALQELIGRHPNMVTEGIQLVQIVDYQAVGLRARAATRMAREAATLDRLYRIALMDALFTWRGVAAASEAGRVDSAVFAGLLVAKRVSATDERASYSIAEALMQRIRNRLRDIKPRDQEERQGLLLAVSWVLSALSYNIARTTQASVPIEVVGTLLPRDVLSSPEFAHILDENFKPRTSRAELVISATLRVFGQYAGFINLLRNRQDMWINWCPNRHRTILTSCLSRSDEVILEQVPQAVRLSMSMLPTAEAHALVRQWVTDLAPENKKIGVREAARVLALGAAFASLAPEDGGSTQDVVLAFLLQRYVHVDTDARIVILQSLKLILNEYAANEHEVAGDRERQLSTISTILLLALHDYTISERGDVGSLVRLAGLAALQEAWKNGILLCSTNDHNRVTDHEDTGHLASLQLHLYDTKASQADHLRSSVLRLSLEKLDKVRLAAADCWRCQSHETQKPRSADTGSTRESEVTDEDTAYLLNHGAPLPPKPVPTHDVCSAAFFYGFLAALMETSLDRHIKLRILEGFCSTAGGAGLGASQNLLSAREALLLFLTSPTSKIEQRRLVLGGLLKEVVDINTKTENEQRLVSVLEVIAFIAELGLLPTELK